MIFIKSGSELDEGYLLFNLLESVLLFTLHFLLPKALSLTEE